MNAIEILPPDFDPAQRYPVVFRVYGGPGSQMASYKFQLDWHTFIASKLRYIVVMVGSPHIYHLCKSSLMTQATG